jgi:acyl-CoA synthetase (AMP-forming)/AMP-acid ligase II
VAALPPTAGTSPHRLWLYGPGGHVRDIGYADLLDQARRVCTALRTRGLVPGDRILVAAKDPGDFLPAFWGAVLAGLVVVPAGEPDRAADLLDTAVAVRARLAVTGRPPAGDDRPAPGRPVTCRVGDLLTAAPATTIAARSGADLVLGLLTSGSTGRPKVVGQTNAAVLANAAAAVAANGFTEADVSLNWFPLDHVGGLVMFHVRDVWLRCAQVQVDTDTVLRDPLVWLDLVDRHRVSVTWAPNFAYQLVTAAVRAHPDRRWDLACLRFLLNGGEAVVAAQCLEFLDALRPSGLAADCMHPAWGMSETCSGVVYSDRFGPETGSRQPVSVGRPVPGCEVRVVDADGAVAGWGVPGALEVRGPMVTGGYLDDDDATKETLHADGWLRTGDRAVIAADGLTVTGRDKDVIIAGGRNLTSGEVESVIDAVDGVDPTWTVAVAVRADDSATDQLAVVFVPAGSAPADEVTERVRRAVLRRFHLRPSHVLAVTRADIPKTSIGKPRRSLIRDRLLRATGPAAPPIVALEFRPATLPPAGARPGPVLLAGGSGSLARDLRAAGHDVTVLARPAGARDRHRTRAALAGALHGGAGCDLVYAVDPEDADMVDACAGLTELLRALTGLPERPAGQRLTVVAPDTPVGAAVAGLAAGAAADLPWLSVRTTHLAGAGGDPLGGGAESREVLLTWPPQALVATVPPAGFGGAASALRTGGRYLVTGGLGGVGRHVCAHLLREFDAHLLVVGSSRAREHADRLAALRQWGDVTYRSVDVADGPALAGVVGAYEAEQGVALAGVLHLAGELVRRAAPDLAAADLEDAGYAKVRGALAVDRLLAERPDAVDVTFTSVHGVVGAPLLGGYAAACRFVDALSARRRLAGRRSWSVAWSKWAGSGMSEHVAGGDLADAMGLLTVRPDDGVRALDTVLRAEPGWYAVGMDVGNRRLAHLSGDCRPLEHVEIGTADATPATIEVTDEFGVSVPADVRTTVPAAPTDQRARVRAALAAAWCELLALPTVAGSDDFFDLGGHSLVLPRLLDLLERDLGVPVPGVVVFEHSQLDELTGVIVDLMATSGAPEPAAPLSTPDPQAADPRAGLRRRQSARGGA